MAAEDVREFYHRQGRAEEQERIIALLEAYIPTFVDLHPNDEASKYPIEGVIALIKGDNK